MAVHTVSPSPSVVQSAALTGPRVPSVGVSTAKVRAAESTSLAVRVTVPFSPGAVTGQTTGASFTGVTVTWTWAVADPPRPSCTR